MAFGTRVKVELYFSHETYNYKYEAESDLQDVRNNMNRIEQQIAMLCAGNPKELLHCKDCEDHDLDAVDVLSVKLQELKEWYKEEVLKEWQLEMLLDNWESRTGDFIDQEKLKEELTSDNKEE